MPTRFETRVALFSGRRLGAPQRRRAAPCAVV